MHELVIQLLSYLKATWRFRWIAVVVAWLIASAGWFVVDRLPDRYRALARVHVDTESVLRPLLSGLAVQPNMDQIVAMMSRTLISRPNLEKVVQMAGMETNPAKSGNRARLVNEVANRVSIRSGGRKNLYTIAYSGRTPQEAKRVVESFLSLFVEESLSDKRKDSESARRFIDDQLKSYGEKLAAAEKAVMEFKRKNVGLMPNEGQGYYARLRDAEDTLRRSRLELREAENSRDAIERQLARYTDLNPAGKVAGEGVSPELDARINSLEQRLDRLRVTYTDQHPDVVALVRLIAHLREERAAKAKLANPRANRSRDLGHQQLIVALSAAEAKVAAMRARVAEHDRRYNELKAVANALPRVEAEYTQLTRDYEVIKGRYNQLVERRESARISGDMEQNSGVMGFRVVDPPRLPRSPSSPNRLRLVTIILLGALLAGFGCAFLLGQFRPTFDNERRLREFSGLPVLGTVVMAWSNPQKARRRRGLFAVVLSIGSLFATYVAIVVSLLLTSLRVS